MSINPSRRTCETKSPISNRPPYTLTVGAVIVLVLAATALTANEIYLYGGRNNSVFLGCWTCSEYHSDSVFNQYGSHGSQYASNSIWNRYGQYGGPYASHSPCNPYGQSPPVLVDDRGGFYGYLTVNRYLSRRVDNEQVLLWLETSVCGDR